MDPSFYYGPQSAFLGLPAISNRTSYSVCEYRNVFENETFRRREWDVAYILAGMQVSPKRYGELEYGGCDSIPIQYWDRCTAYNVNAPHMHQSVAVQMWRNEISNSRNEDRYSGRPVIEQLVDNAGSLWLPWKDVTPSSNSDASAVVISHLPSLPSNEAMPKDDKSRFTEESSEMKRSWTPVSPLTGAMLKLSSLGVPSNYAVPFKKRKHTSGDSDSSVFTSLSSESNCTVITSTEDGNDSESSISGNQVYFELQSPSSTNAYSPSVTVEAPMLELPTLEEQKASKRVKRECTLTKGGKQYRCEECGKVMTNEHSFRSHERRHVAKARKSYQCSQCDKTFVQKSSLVTHMRIHTGERPFKCERCTYTFSDYSTFVKHGRTHTGEQPYVCKVCDRGFSQSGNLIRHQRIHETSKRKQRSR